MLIIIIFGVTLLKKKRIMEMLKRFISIKRELSKKIRIEWPKDEYMSVKTKIERSLSNKNGDMGL